ncbi:cysteine synthase A [Pseudonocardia thermophila]|jgi:2,3-diaminopropionate biosynthesis protein SbnA|uniref:Cysteine synthase A n=1 Tax=Pseudonocardia thermophila TaxID=1848 RepID=A0A1M7B752_PSETH|nr:2,3-diaminopropionate biosynthesis protein SbnA [Pseudonocardia thermophila]SHL50835.1 cysteine synthase A [Pseudonocardia thermophila]
MAVVSSPLEFSAEQVFVDLGATFGRRLYLKIEGFNFAGSVKMKAALGMVEAAERAGILEPDSVIVESSSGNLGVALAVIAANRGYGFVCVTDTRCNPATRRIMEALGARIHTVRVPDPHGGYLGARINYVKALCAADARHVWLNQYANPANWGAHLRTTAPAIDREFPQLDVLFVGAGTTGTLMGCARYFRQRFEEGHRRVRIVAVDAAGSVTFGGPAKPRMIPGLGTSVVPDQLDESFVDDVVIVEEEDTVRTCRRMATNGFLFGGSTGTVVSGALRWLAENGAPGLTSVAISPDFGERYLDTIYHDGWVADTYGTGVLGDAETLPMRVA